MSRVLITGCSTGIGRATAIELNRRGHEVVATARRHDTLSSLDVTDRQLDVDDPDSIRAAVETAGEVDVLVNNAAWGAIGPIETIPLDEVRAMYETNVIGALRMLQAVLPGMRERGGGTIVNVSSLAGLFASMPLNGLYSSTKFALEAITETLRYECGPSGSASSPSSPDGPPPLGRATSDGSASKTHPTTPCTAT
jgi:NAD(P)-dependent dehydrogenase (short-subunit alcohol dehydrogenase family)